MGRIVNAYLELAEDRAQRQIPMTMEDWAKRLDAFLEFDDREPLAGAGSISAEMTKEHSESEFEKFRPIQDLVEVVNSASEATVDRLDRNFFRVRFDRLTNSEKAMLRAMAELGAGPYKLGDVAEVMGLKPNSLSPRRAKLINKGMVYSPEHGAIAFTVPLFDEFMRSSVPEFESKKS